MCGIAGFYSEKRAIDHALFDKMVDIVAHRGPDGRGVFYDGNLALGHRRLSIIELSDTGAQPFVYKDRYILIFNGEIYNYIELREELSGAGCTFTTRTDTETIVAAYDYWGKDCVFHLNGMWAFALYDREKKTLFCSRDRFGVKPFYYFRNESIFAFASEIKQLLCMPEVRHKADRDALLHYIMLGEQDYSERTMFEDVKSLLPGHNLVVDFNAHTFIIEQYHSLQSVQEVHKSYEEDGKDFRECFMESVKIRLRSDVPLGYCLSGGLDSSAILCVADQLYREGEKHTVSSCFDDPAYDEREYIDEVIKHVTVIPHQVFPNIHEVLDELDNMIYYMDEPITSTSFYSQWNVFREAKKQGLTVMLDGQGADEQLAGYTFFYSVRFAELAKKWKFIAMRREIKQYMGIRAITDQDAKWQSIMLSAIFAALPIPRFFRYIIRARREKMINSFFTKEQLKQIYRHYDCYDVGNTQKYIFDSIYRGLQSIFHDEDRASMAFSMESRVPFMDVRLVERVYAMPFDRKIRDGITKAVVREGLKNVLPEKITKRYSKLGFTSPEDKWMNENAAMIGDELRRSCIELRSMFDPDDVIKWYGKVAGKIRRGNPIVWRLIAAGHWVKVFHVEL